jgi:GTP-binding protein
VPRKSHLRNVAIVAHVDHGKTTLVDALLRQSGIFREGQVVDDRVMDSMDLERERGITILAKNTALRFRDVKLNVVDTPGHADFGGEVERSLHMVDGALLLVDSSEGPLPQTRFVLKKVLERRLPVVLVINKIDRKDARADEVLQEVYDLFIDLGADDAQLEFPVIYTNAREGVAHREIGDDSTDLLPLFETVLEAVPGPDVDDEGSPQLLVTSLDYDSYVGQLAIGRVVRGRFRLGETYGRCVADGGTVPARFSVLYSFDGLRRVQVEEVEAGDVVAFAGIDEVHIGDTISDVDAPEPLPRIEVDALTVAMVFMVNDGPFAGLEGKFVTSRQIKARLELEMRRNVALDVQATERADAYEVRGRGELQLAVLIETMRREGYEFLVSRPEVITRRDDDGRLLEPMEHVFVDLPDEFVGVVTEKISQRKGRMLSLENHGSGRVDLEFMVPSRGMIGFRGEFLTDTRGQGVLSTLVAGWEPWCGEIPQRVSGALVADRQGKVTSYASLSMEDRGELFVAVGTAVYRGMLVGERNRPQDLDVNIVRERKVSNVRSSTGEILVTLRPPKLLTLDQAIEFIANDELVEITPQSIRLRKRVLDPSEREVLRKKAKKQA